MNTIINLGVYSDVLTVTSAARLLETSRAEIYRLLTAGYIKEMIIYDKRMVTRASLEHYRNLKAQIKALEEQIQALAEENENGNERGF